MIQYPRLQKAVDALVAEVADSKTKLSSIKAFVKSVPDLIAEAVADALKEHEVTDEEAADTINAARVSISYDVDVVLAAVSHNTPADDNSMGGGNASQLPAPSYPGEHPDAPPPVVDNGLPTPPPVAGQTPSPTPPPVTKPPTPTQQGKK